VFQDVLDDVVAVLVLQQLVRVLVQLLQDASRLLGRAVLQDALNDAAAVGMRRQGVHLWTREQRKIELLPSFSRKVAEKELSPSFSSSQSPSHRLRSPRARVTLQRSPKRDFFGSLGDEKREEKGTEDAQSCCLSLFDGKTFEFPWANNANLREVVEVNLTRHRKPLLLFDVT